ncbi:hypothetical protein PAT3040_02580 [Paenibacillus agaridevorans]|uniref:Uncharacterized protein n=1 Tax=Paenibacillus agaridevorans TaxID=171404 RepID=A0A2R5EW46_9BACL|nr:hypothetical protein [Paenibacillus agaridevorans]GBG08013.1 hypothetical protein PAT3040_02580 [Paenibacillus agaridevorans]
MNVPWSKATKAGIIAVTTCALFLQPSTLIYQPATVNAAASSVTSQIIKLNSNSTIALQSAQFLMQGNGRVLAYTVLITNNGNSEIPLKDYWIRLKTSSGKSFSTKVSEQDKNVSSIAPKSSKLITYYSYVDQTTILTDLNFDIIMWDFSVSNYERRLGTIKYPAGSSEQTSANKAATMLYSNIKLTSTINSLSLTQDDNLAYLQINYNIENQGLNVVDLSTLNLFIQTKGSAVYPVNMIDYTGISLQPKQQNQGTLQIALPKSLIGQSLSLVSAFKEETTGIMLPVASFALPAIQDSTLVETGKAKATSISGEKINTFVDRAFLESGDTSSVVSIQYAMRNTGKQAVEYPNFSFSLITEKGIIYPLDFKKSDDVKTKLLPQMREVIDITGAIPSTIDISKSKLLVRAGITDKSEGYVVGSYKLVTSPLNTLDSEYKYGDYTVKIKAIQRTASSANDVLIADIEVMNNTEKSKAVPELSGYFVINGVKLNNPTQKITLDNSVTIGPKLNNNFIVHVNIPYAAEINNISFVLTEKSGDVNTEKTIYRFNGQKLKDIPAINVNTSYHISNAGRQAEAKITKTKVYEGNTENYFYAELEVTNKETRAALLSGYSGYLKNQEGQVIPVTFSKIEEKVDANGRVLLIGWAKMRKNVNIKQYDLIFGQTASSSPTVSENQTSSIMVKPVQYSLKSLGTSESQKSLSNIAVAGHELTLKRVNTMLNVEGMYTVTGLKLLFNYDLLKNENYDYIAGDHKIMIEFVDQDSSKATYSKVYSLGSSEGDYLKVGEGVPHEIVFQDSLIQSKVQSYGKYILNIYDVFQGAKILIATKELKWFMPE